MKVGDEVVCTDANGKRHFFRVVQVEGERFKLLYYLNNREKTTWYSKATYDNLRPLTKLEKALK